jgi:hypothetical protein
MANLSPKKRIGRFNLRKDLETGKVYAFDPVPVKILEEDPVVTNAWKRWYDLNLYQLGITFGSYFDNPQRAEARIVKSYAA